jgi:aminoglycoside 3-N-acetyltransferase
MLTQRGARIPAIRAPGSSKADPTRCRGYDPDVPDRETPPELPLATRSLLLRDLRAAGVREGTVLMVHTSMRTLGWVVGGAQTVVEALVEALGPGGTVMAICGWDEDRYRLDYNWPPPPAYFDELPAFDPAIARAHRGMGVVPERLRTWPGALRSSHPEASVVALGLRAQWIIEPHPADFPSGPGSPLARLVEADGQVLMLGAPLKTITLLHHAESLANGRDKRFVTYRMPVLEHGKRVWGEFQDIDTSSRGAFPYEEVIGPDRDGFDAIGRDALDAGVGREVRIAASTSHLFDAAPLVHFGIDWIESRFPSG